MTGIIYRKEPTGPEITGLDPSRRRIYVAGFDYPTFFSDSQEYLGYTSQQERDSGKVSSPQYKAESVIVDRGECGRPKVVETVLFPILS
jgi:hypothetical protein